MNKSEAVASALAQLDNPNPPGSYALRGASKRIGMIQQQQVADKAAEKRKAEAIEQFNNLTEEERQETQRAGIEKFYATGNRRD